MTQGRVVDEGGHEVEGVLRSNGIVTFTVGRLTRHISLDDFSDLGMTWKPMPSNSEQVSKQRDPIDSPRFFRIVGEGL